VNARTYYLLAAFDSAQFAGGSGMETMSISPNHDTLPLALQPVWSVVEQTSETDPGYGHISERLIAGGLTLVEATQRLSHLLKTVATPVPFSAVRLGDDPSSGSGQAVDTCLIIYHRHHHEE
jgi:hypothetical protein